MAAWVRSLKARGSASVRKGAKAGLEEGRHDSRMTMRAGTGARGHTRELLGTRDAAEHWHVFPVVGTGTALGAVIR